MPPFAIDGPVGRAVQRFAGHPTFARYAPRVLSPVDRTLNRVTGGRVMLSKFLLPSLVLTTTGARSGLARETPLMCVPDDDGTFVVVGSNFGREGHPAWTGNLLKDPDAEVARGGKVTPVRAELLEGEERARAWAAALARWPTFDRYQARVDREIRIFRLHPR